MASGRRGDEGGVLRYHSVLVRPKFLAAWGNADKSWEPFIDLVAIPAGSFMMGSPEDETDHFDDENQVQVDDENQVQVRITKPFRMGRTVITQAQWRAVMGTEPWANPELWWEPEDLWDPCDDDFPAVGVRWDDAVLFCEKLTDLERETGRLSPTQSYRLPTEAEWEYACRAGTTTAFSFGDDPEELSGYGWYRYSSNEYEILHRVAELEPNPWGLFDMHGNVLQWCADWYEKTLVGGDDPVGPAAGSGRVLRGGCKECDVSGCRSASRTSYDPWHRHGLNGFRVVVLC